MFDTDIAIIGGGPAGLTAALYAQRGGWQVMLFEKLMPGGQINTTPEVANYPGLPATDGYSIGAAMAEQVKALGVPMIAHEVTALNRTESGFALSVADRTITARAVVLALGARRRTLDVEGEARLFGRGVSYCAVCDGHFFKDKPVAVVGGGNTALEDALYLAKLCPTVHLVHRRHEFRGSKHLQDQISHTPNITLHLAARPVVIEGDNAVQRLLLDTGDELDVAAVFVAVGTVADSALVANLLDLDEQGRVVADESGATAVPGLFVSGDLRAKPLYQIVTATADGAYAATAAGQYLERQG